MALSKVALITLSILLVEHCTTVTLTRFTQQRVDAPRAMPAVVVLFTEMLKLALAMCLELTHSFGMGSSSSLDALVRAVHGRPRDTLRVSVPACLYTVQNISIFVALGNLEVVSFQVLYQLKLMLTAVLSVIFLGRTLTGRHWATLVVLTAGVIAVELSDANLKPSPSPPSPSPPATATSGRLLSEPVPPLGEALTLEPLEGLFAGTWHRSGERRALESRELYGVAQTAFGSIFARRLSASFDSSGSRSTPSARKTSSSVRAASSVRANTRSNRLSGGDGGRASGRNAGGRSEQRVAGSAVSAAPAASSLPVHSERQPALGVLAAVLAATLSSFAGVYFEALVKGREESPPSLWVRNVQLCLFTIPLAALAVGVRWSTVQANGFFTGLDLPTLLLITLNASGGLLVAAVIKYGDNILKNFTTSCSVILGTVVSVYLFDFQLSLQFVWGSTLVVLSAYAYATAPTASDIEKPKQPRESELYKPLADGSDGGASDASERRAEV